MCSYHNGNKRREKPQYAKEQHKNAVPYVRKKYTNADYRREYA